MTDKSKKTTSKADREARLAENLRANLRRRKQAVRKAASVKNSDKDQ